jgi:uncharacterized caspase-like protein
MVRYIETCIKADDVFLNHPWMISQQITESTLVDLRNPRRPIVAMKNESRKAVAVFLLLAIASSAAANVEAQQIPRPQNEVDDVKAEPPHFPMKL